ncbi:MAG: hypothetical protein E7337_10665 [Clostridiales bacterium]|nr:hypothetical protein [Clostridiales bacterium]
MKKEFVTFVLIFLAALGIVSIGLAYVMIWHGGIVLTALRFAAVFIPAAVGISILLAFLRCLPDLWKKN